MVKVNLVDLNKRYGELEAVKDFNLEVESGKFVCMLGPSGCGKTTTLRMIAGLEKQDSGDIYIGDRLVNDLSPKERDISMVFQFYAIYPGMSVYENLEFPLLARKTPKPDRRDRVKEIAQILRIDHLLDEMAMKLTVGEKQRVAIGRAIVRKPQVYLLDEPLTNLDARLRSQMRVELKNIQRELGQTTIYVTHDQLEGMTMADKIAVMNKGLMQQYDVPENVYQHPSNLFVAGFVGSPTMNFLDCTFKEQERKALLDFGEFTVDVTDMRNLVKDSAAGTELILGVRPENIEVSERKVSANRIEAKIDVVEPIGDKILFDVMIGDSLLKVYGPPYSRLDMGDKVWLSFDHEKMHIIDKKTEKVIV